VENLIGYEESLNQMVEPLDIIIDRFTKGNHMKRKAKPKKK